MDFYLLETNKSHKVDQGARNPLVVVMGYGGYVLVQLRLPHPVSRPPCASLAIHQPPVDQPYLPPAVLGEARVVGDDQEGGAVFAVDLAQQREHVGGGLGVEVAGRLAASIQPQGFRERTCA